MEPEDAIEDAIEDMALLFMHIKVEPHRKPVSGKKYGLNAGQGSDLLYQGARLNQVSSYTDWGGNTHAEEKALPIELLGQKFKEIRSQFIAVISDGDFFFQGDGYAKGTWRWFVIDKDRCYLMLGTEDDTISSMYTSDSCYSTGYAVILPKEQPP